MIQQALLFVDISRLETEIGMFIQDYSMKCMASRRYLRRF